MRFCGKRRASLLVALVLGSCLGAQLMAENVANAQASARDQVVRQIEAWLSSLRRADTEWTARMTGCGGWECNDATIHLRLPGRMRIEYDYGSVVVSDGTDLVAYDGSGDEVDRRPLLSAPLSLLLSGELGGDIRVDAIEEIDRGASSEGPRHIVQAEISREGGPRLTLFFAKQRFRLIGWRAGGPRGGFEVRIRDLHRAQPSAGRFDVPAGP